MLSKNGIGIAVLILGMIGVQVTDNMLADFVLNVANLAGSILLIWHQFERSETFGFFFKDK